MSTMILPNDDEPVTAVTVAPVAPEWREIIRALCQQRQDVLEIGLGVQAAQLEKILHAVTGLRRRLFLEGVR